MPLFWNEEQTEAGKGIPTYPLLLLFNSSIVTIFINLINYMLRWLFRKIQIVLGESVPDKLFVSYPCTEICKCTDLVVSCQFLSHNIRFTFLPVSFIYLNVLFFFKEHFYECFIVSIWYCWLCPSYILVLLWFHRIPVLWRHIKLNQYWFY